MFEAFHLSCYYMSLKLVAQTLTGMNQFLTCATWLNFSRCVQLFRISQGVCNCFSADGPKKTEHTAAYLQGVLEKCKAANMKCFLEALSAQEFAMAKSSVSLQPEVKNSRSRPCRQQTHASRFNFRLFGVALLERASPWSSASVSEG